GWNHADEVLGLLERNVRWKRRHIRIGVRFQYNRAISRKRLVPSSPYPVGTIDKDALQPDQLGISVIRKVWDALGGFGLARNQFATDPESAVMMALSGKRGDNSQNTRCGLSGSAEFIARDSRVSHHSFSPCSMPRLHEDSFFCVSIGNKARSVVALSPTMLTSMG